MSWFMEFVSWLISVALSSNKLFLRTTNDNALYVKCTFRQSLQFKSRLTHFSREGSSDFWELWHGEGWRRKGWARLQCVMQMYIRRQLKLLCSVNIRHLSFLPQKIANWICTKNRAYFILQLVLVIYRVFAEENDVFNETEEVKYLWREDGWLVVTKGMDRTVCCEFPLLLKWWVWHGWGWDDLPDQDDLFYQGNRLIENHHEGVKISVPIQWSFHHSDVTCFITKCTSYGINYPLTSNLEIILMMLSRVMMR